MRGAEKPIGKNMSVSGNLARRARRLEIAAQLFDSHCDMPYDGLKVLADVTNELSI